MQQYVPFLHRPEDRTHLVQERYAHRRRDLLFQLLPLRVRQLDQVLQVVVASTQNQVIHRNAESIADKRQKIVRHTAVVHKAAQGSYLAFLHLLPDVLHDIAAFLVIQVNIRIPRNLDTVTAFHHIPRKDAGQVGPDNIVDKHDIILPFMRRQLDKTGNFRVRDLHQGIIILWHIIRLCHPLALLYHPDNQVKTAVAYKRTDISRLYHHRRKEGEDLFVKEVVHKFFMERFRIAVLVQIDILPVQLLQYF